MTAISMAEASGGVAQRIIVVSNRLPVGIQTGDDGEPHMVPGSGGLVTAMSSVLRGRRGRWLGWTGSTDAVASPHEIEALGRELGYDLEAVALTEEEVSGFYEGFANDVIWPLFHDLSGHCNFDSSRWPIYEEVNDKFARAVAESSTEADYVWVHDYQLMLVAQSLHRLGVQRRLGFFLHIPFPPLDVFIKLPWRQEILEGLLHFDLLGFQTDRDVRNFVQCVRHRIEGIEIERSEALTRLRIGDRVVRIGTFPISIDYADFLRRSVDDHVSELVARVRMKLPSRALVLGLDRLDYTKGIPNRLEAFDTALRLYPELRGKVTLLQIVVPSRTGVGEYQHLKDEIDRLVGRVNGDYAAAGWTPIQYIFRRLEPTELLAYYRACDVALITPLKDGMNLVCKEYCACSLEDDGVLILSEFAGAAAELDIGALLVNPYDTDAVAEAIRTAITMPETERRARMQRLRAHIRHHNVARWSERFLAAAAEADAALHQEIDASASSTRPTSTGSATR
jgi:trehalose 6-phosphate synthase/phosphatase